MQKFLVIFKREYAQVVRKKSFIVGLLLTPTIMIVSILLPAYIAETKATDSERIAVIDQSGTDLGDRFIEALKAYKIEKTGKPYYLLTNKYDLRPSDQTLLDSVLESVRNDINGEQLKYCLVIRPNAQVIDSNLYLISNSDNFVTLKRFEQDLSQILSSRRLQTSNINLPVDSVLKLTARIDLRRQDAKGESIPFEVKYFGGFIMVMLIFIMIITYGALVMRSVIEEKNSRVMEVLVSSVTPFQLMLGKILGLGAATLTQVAIWITLLLGLYFGAGPLSLTLDPSVSRLIFNPVIVTFFVLFLISGYIMYSTLFALIGSLVNSEKEAQNFVMPISFSMMIPVFFGIRVVQEPNSLFSLALSFIPLFSPTMMMMRVVFVAPTATSYSLFSGILGEASLAFILVCLTTAGVIWVTARVFRVGILMYGKRPTLPEIIRWIKY